MEDASHGGVTEAYIFGLALLAMAALSGWVIHFGLPLNVSALGASAVLALGCAVGRRFPVQFGRATVDIADVAALTAVLLVGPVWAVLVAAPTMIYRPWQRTLFVCSGDVLKLVAAGSVLYGFSGPLLQDGSLDGRFVGGALLGMTLSYVLDAANGCLHLRLKYGTPPTRTLSEVFAPLTPSSAIAMAAALGVCWAATSFGPVAALVLFAGSAGAAVSLHLLQAFRARIEALRQENAALKAENESVHASPLNFASRLVYDLDARDGRSARLAAASAVYAGDLARELGLDATTTAKLRTAALLADVGLVSVPDELHRTPPAKLNSLGRRKLEEHPVRSERVLAAAPGFEEAARWVRWHHERVDGTGYPDRLRGEWLPLEAKIVAVGSAYASMVLDGIHRPALCPQEARRQVVEQIDRALDRQVVKVLLRLLDEEGESYASAADGRFAFPAVSGGGTTGSGGSALGHAGTAGEA